MTVGKLLDFLFRRGGGRPPQERWTDQPRVSLGPGPGFHFDIVGEGSYLATLRRMDGGRLAQRQEVVGSFLIVPEPDNRFDPNAIMIVAEGFGVVGYFSRGDAIRYKALATALLAQHAIGEAAGCLTGGWDEDINIGVRLSIRPPRAFDPNAAEHDLSPTVLLEGWEAMGRVALGPGENGFTCNVSYEYYCRETIARLDGGRTDSGDPVVFPVTLIPQMGTFFQGQYPKEPQIIVWADGFGVVGSFSAATVSRYTEVFTGLRERRAVGTCDGIVFRENDDWLGVKLSIKGPKGALAALTLSGTE